MSVLSEKEQDIIKQSIEWAENATSGEIRVCIESKCELDAYQRAVECFYDLGMEDTKLRNGVLIYVALDDHKFAIIGDKAINELVATDFWDTTKALMLEKLKAGNVAEGISVAIIEAGKQLKRYFPYNSNDVNELSDDIVFLK